MRELKLDLVYNKIKNEEQNKKYKQVIIKFCVAVIKTLQPGTNDD